MAGATQDPAKWLAGMGKQWKNDAKRAKEEGGFGPKMDDGSYNARLTNAELQPVTGGGYRSKLSFVITEGPNTGKPVIKSDGLDGPESMYYLAVTLGRMGIDPETISPDQIPTIYAKLAKEKPVCEIALKTGSNGYQNVYVNSVADDGAGAAGAAGATTETDDETEGETETEADTVTLEVGMKVGFAWKGADETGEVIEILGDEEPPTVRVRKDSDSKVAKVPIERLSLATATEEDETE